MKPKAEIAWVHQGVGGWEISKIVVLALSMQKRNNEKTKEESSPLLEAVSRLALYLCCTNSFAFWQSWRAHESCT
jgi:hypothetical protein